MSTSVLVIEDDITSMTIITKILSGASYTVIKAEDGETGLKRLVEHRGIKIILLDWMLPGISGIEVLKKLRSNPQYSQIKVIMQTANQSSKDVQEAIAAGADDYIVKPIESSVLLSKVIKALHNPREA